MPQPGVPYRPIVAVPQKLTEINSFLKRCTAIFFTALDPPQALISEPAPLPPVPPSSAKPVLAQTSSQNPGTIGHLTTAVPGPPPLRDLPQATGTPVKISSLGISSPKLQPNDPTAHTISPSQPRPSSGNAKTNSDPEQSSESSVKSDQKQHPSKSYLPSKIQRRRKQPVRRLTVPQILLHKATQSRLIIHIQSKTKLNIVVLHEASYKHRPHLAPQIILSWKAQRLLYPLFYRTLPVLSQRITW